MGSVGDLEPLYPIPTSEMSEQEYLVTLIIAEAMRNEYAKRQSFVTSDDVRVFVGAHVYVPLIEQYYGTVGVDLYRVARIDPGSAQLCNLRTNEELYVSCTQDARNVNLTPHAHSVFLSACSAYRAFLSMCDTALDNLEWCRAQSESKRALAEARVTQPFQGKLFAFD